jgi:outer membrane receptor for ferrienterochelin and colicin
MINRLSILLTLALVQCLSMTLALASDGEKIDITQISLEQLLETEFIPASRIARQISDAPSAVSIVTAQDIHDFGYRSLSDILKSMRGLYVTSGLNYEYLGGRGFGSPKDYAGRIMLVIDGYVSNENVYNQIFLGEDALINVDMIDRVEYIPGPGSTTYGNSAFLGVINIRTKRGQDFDSVQLAADVDDNNSRRARLSYGKQFDNGAEILLSVSKYKDDGLSVTFPELDDWESFYGDPYTNQAISPIKKTSTERLFFKGSVNNWTLELATSQREQEETAFMTSFEPADFDSRNYTSDKNSFLKLNHDSELYEDLKLSTQLYFGQYDYGSDDQSFDGYRETQASQGKWRGVSLTFIGSWFEQHKVLFGIEYRDDYQQSYSTDTSDPAYDYFYNEQNDYHTKTTSVFVQDEYRVTDRLTLVPGLRYDYITNFDSTLSSNIFAEPFSSETDLENSLSPRMAAIYQPWPASTIKLSYGKAFRNINPWEDIQYIYSAPPSNKEAISTLELVWQQQISSKTRVTTSLYRNKITDAISPIYYDLDTIGQEIGIEHVSSDGFRLNASLAHQVTEDNFGEQLYNSPHWLAKLNMAQPIFQNKAMLGFEIQATGDRLDIENNDVSSDTVTNLTLSSNQVLPDTDIRFSIRNMFDTQRKDVLKHDVLTALPLEGRNFWLQLEYNFR